MVASDSKYPPEDNDKYDKLSCEFKRHVVASVSRMILHYLACEQSYLYSTRIALRMRELDNLWCQITQVCIDRSVQTNSLCKQSSLVQKVLSK